MEREEKKVEYLELIYDLIFVYVIGRNNSLLHHITGGFVDLPTFLAYLLCSLAVIQIWNFSTYYINMFGRNRVRDHVFLFLNMYLLYYIAEGTRLHWESYQRQYHAAWGLILVNIGVQYLLERQNRKCDAQTHAVCGKMALVLFGEAAIVFAGIPLYRGAGRLAAPVAIAFGIAATFLSSDARKVMLVDFAHLSERAMLYVVFTFGEMIVVIASYFEGDFNFNSLYFSLMCFLVVVGLFLAYEVLYDRLIDRNMQTNGLLYMLIHILLIFSLNNTTTALSFMENEQIALMPKMLFLLSSFLLCHFCIFALTRYSRRELLPARRELLVGIPMAIAFSALMLLLRTRMNLNIALSVVYVFAIWWILYRYARPVKETISGCEFGSRPEKG